MSDTGAERASWLQPMAGRDPAEAHRASTPLELFFDLTFVVAIAQAADQLHHALAAGEIVRGVGIYVMVFWGIWWAWMNFTWFASAYDTDDVAYRLLTLLQMAGVLVYSAGVPAVFEHFNFKTVVSGYVIMRLALVVQWARAAHADPHGRTGTVRYGIGVATVQLAWIAWLLTPTSLESVVGFVVLVAAELAVPAWAEFAGRSTPWHPGHITERHGLLIIIVLGEVVASIATAVGTAHIGTDWSLSPLTAAVAGLLLVFTLWWSYFKHAATQRILRRSLSAVLAWAYAHYLLFAAVAALGAGLRVVIDTLGGHSQLSASAAALTVAVPVAIFAIVLGLVTETPRTHPVGAATLAVAVVLTLLIPLTAHILPLPMTLLLITMLETLLLAQRLVSSRRRVNRNAGSGRKPCRPPRRSPNDHYPRHTRDDSWRPWD